MVPKQSLPQCSHRFKAFKQTPHRFLYLTIRRHFNTSVPGSFITNRNHGQNLSAEHFLPICFLRPLAQYADLKLTHGPFQPQQHSVIEQTGIVNALGIDHERFCQHAEINQMVPIPIVARQPGGLQSQHRSDFAVANCGQKPGKSWPLMTAGA